MGKKQTLSKSQKFIIVLWGFYEFLIALILLENYQHRVFRDFLFLSIPTILYWSGVWIWGFGYILKFFSFLRPPFKRKQKINNSNTKVEVRFGRIKFLEGVFCVCFLSSILTTTFKYNAPITPILYILFTTIIATSIIYCSSWIIIKRSLDLNKDGLFTVIPVTIYQLLGIILGFQSILGIIFAFWSFFILLELSLKKGEVHLDKDIKPILTPSQMAFFSFAVLIMTIFATTFDFSMF